MKPINYLTTVLIICILIFFLSFTFNNEKFSSVSNTGFSNAELLLTIYPKTFTRDIIQVDRLSQDGRMIGYLKEGDIWLYDPVAMKERKLEQSDEFDWITQFEWQGNSNFIKMTGFTEGDLESKIISLGDEQLEIEIQGSFDDIALLDRQLYAFKFIDQENNEGGVYLKKRGEIEPVLILPDIYPVSMSISPDAGSLAYLYNKIKSNLTLAIYSIEGKSTRDVKGHLDGSERTRIGFTSDGEKILISLAREEPLDPVEKHKPVNYRNFDIYALDLQSGALIPLTSEEDDDILIAVDGDRAYWNINKAMVKTVLITKEDGKISPLIPEQSFRPSWHPSGKEIAVVYGEWRMVDFPLNWDIGSFKVNKKGEVSDDLSSLITGYHGDFGLSWSSDGSRMVYKSHRSQEPVLFFDSEGSTDDIYLRSEGDTGEIRLTDFCRDALIPEFSPDGNKVLFCASEKDNYRMKAWIVDLEDGNAKKEVKSDEIKGHVFGATWAPDGEHLALEVSDGSVNKSIWLLNTDGSEAELITTFESLSLVSGIDITPDGSEIIFSALDNGRHQVFSIPIKGGEKVKITDSPYDIIFPKVSPDGSKIAATVFRNTKQIWVADIVL